MRRQRAAAAALTLVSFVFLRPNFGLIRASATVALAFKRCGA